MRVEAADQHGFADACFAGQRKEAGQGLAIGVQPVGGSIGLGWHMADVIACGKTMASKPCRSSLRALPATKSMDTKGSWAMGVAAGAGLRAAMVT
jgi:hypothetical protein